MKAVSRRQRGFTLIEVAVAFAIFALCIGALYEAFSGTMRRTSQAREHELAWLHAQSVLSELRVRPGPWAARSEGKSDAGFSWQVDTAPFNAGTDAQSSWHAYQVTVHVRGPRAKADAAVLNSIEIARSAP